MQGARGMPVRHCRAADKMLVGQSEATPKRFGCGVSVGVFLESMYASPGPFGSLQKNKKIAE